MLTSIARVATLCLVAGYASASAAAPRPVDLFISVSKGEGPVQLLGVKFSDFVSLPMVAVANATGKKIARLGVDVLYSYPEIAARSALASTEGFYLDAVSIDASAQAEFVVKSGVLRPRAIIAYGNREDVECVGVAAY